MEIDHIPESTDDVNEVVPEPLPCPLCPATGEIAVFAADPNEQGRQFKGLFSFCGPPPCICAVALLGDQPAVVRLNNAELQIHGGLSTKPLVLHQAAYGRWSW